MARGDKTTTKKINLALQGGGAHGAYTWGVLDALLEDGRLDFEAVTATSAGSMNAAILIHGLQKNGNDGARALLEKFWKRISDTGAFINPMHQSMTSAMTPHNFAFNWFDQLSRTFSPYQLNPLNFNPLKNILDEMIDFDKLRSNKNVNYLYAPQMCVAASQRYLKAMNYHQMCYVLRRHYPIYSKPLKLTVNIIGMAGIWATHHYGHYFIRQRLQTF